MSSFGSDAMISSKKAYLAFQLLLWDYSVKWPCRHIVGLWADMGMDNDIREPDMIGKPPNADPAALELWEKLWGADTSKDGAAALEIANRFLREEYGWSDEEGMQKLLSLLASEIAIHGSTEIGDAWRDALTRVKIP